MRQGLLTSVFSLVIGLERVFHLDEIADAGFARLCGGRRCPSRYTIGGWRRHLGWYQVDAFCRRTFPWHLLRQADAMVSFDEHTIPRWTKKFRIGKGYVTTRNKYMRREKLFTGFDLESGRFLTRRGTPGNVGLQELAAPLVRQVLKHGRPRTLHALFDAGAAKSDAGVVRALWDLVGSQRRLDVTLRGSVTRTGCGPGSNCPAACSYPSRNRACASAPHRRKVRLAETHTVLKGETAEQAVRTIICREVPTRVPKGPLASAVHDLRRRPRRRADHLPG